MKAFPLNYLVGGGFLLTDSFHRFSAEKPVGYTKFQFAEDLCTVKLGGEACVLRCVYLFICLFIACLYVCFLITLRKLFVASCISSVVQRRGDWGRGGYFCVLAGELWPNIFSFAFDARQDVMKSLPSFLIYCCYCLQLFILLLSIASLNQCIDLVCKSVYQFLLRGNYQIIIKYSVRGF